MNNFLLQNLYAKNNLVIHHCLRAFNWPVSLHGVIWRLLIGSFPDDQTIKPYDSYGSILLLQYSEYCIQKYLCKPSSEIILKGLNNVRNYIPYNS